MSELLNGFTYPPPIQSTKQANGGFEDGKKKGKMVVGGEHDFSQPLTNPSPLYFSFLFFH